MFDLHIHSTYSDGEFTIDELLVLLKSNHIKYFSITDHDSISSIYEMNSKIHNMNYIKGIEINSLLDNQYKLHILGYHIDENNEELISLCEELKQLRYKRFLQLLPVLKEKYNFTFNTSDIEHILAITNIPGKPHLAKLMVKYGYVSDVEEAFNKYLKYIDPMIKNCIDARRVIDVIHKANGIAILAHPKKYEDKYNVDFRVIMDRLVELGIDGIEIYNSLHTYEDCIRYNDYALEYQLVTSGGSDYHGVRVKPHVKIALYNKDNIKDMNINIIPSDDN